MTDAIPDALRAALDGRYDLARVLGKGGMATVYLASDRKHRRDVALKVLRPDLAASIGIERFLKEIAIAARLNHPHILALHDSGEAGGFLYYVMPFIDGGSLRTRLDSGVSLGVPAALALTASVAGALAYAHRAGVLHRDIKPENILFSAEHPIVADFGIAKAISTAGGEHLTRTGFPLGTPGYMSPEQAAGLTDLDERTDVYSLAVVCYEMLVGRTPGGWPTEDALRAGRFVEAPAGHRRALDLLPGTVEAALVRAMAIRLDQRTPTPLALVEQLGGGTVPALLGTTGPRALSPPPKRRYRDEEVQAVLKRAAELDVAQPTLGGALTLGAIEAAAAEAGIDPALVRQAAALREPTAAIQTVDELRTRARPFTARWFAGGPTRVLVERVVAGELTESDCAYLVEEIRSAIGHNGFVSSLGRTVNWTASQRGGAGAGRDVQVTFTMRGGQSRITIRENMGYLAGGIFGGIGGGVGGGGLGPLSGLLASMHALTAAAFVALLPLWLGGVYATARHVYYRTSTGRVRRLEALADRLAEHARALIADAALPPPPPRGALPGAG